MAFRILFIHGPAAGKYTVGSLVAKRLDLPLFHNQITVDLVKTLFELRCADEAVERRIGNPSRAQFGKLTDPVVFRKIRSQGGFEFPPLPKALVCIDTENFTPEQSAEAIVNALGRH